MDVSSCQHFGAVEVHDLVGICVVLFREFGLCPFCDEVSQHLRFNSSPWLICYFKWQELNDPFGNPPCGVAIVYDVIEWYFGSHRDRTLLKVVSRLSRCHKDRIRYLLIVWVSGFAWCKDHRYIV